MTGRGTDSVENEPTSISGDLQSVINNNIYNNNTLMIGLNVIIFIKNIMTL